MYNTQPFFFRMLLDIERLVHDHTLETRHVTLLGGNLKVAVDDTVILGQ